MGADQPSLFKVFQSIVCLFPYSLFLLFLFFLFFFVYVQKSCLSYIKPFIRLCVIVILYIPEIPVSVISSDPPSACGSVATTISKRCCHHMPTPYQSSKKPTHLKNPIIKRLESGNPSCNTDYVTVTASTIRELRARDVASPIQLTIPRLHDFWPIYLHFLFNA